jgi:hypothetical protein
MLSANVTKREHVANVRIMFGVCWDTGSAVLAHYGLRYAAHMGPNCPPPPGPVGSSLEWRSIGPKFEPQLG